MHLVRIHRLGVPQETREAFDLLERAKRLDPHLADRLRKMVGFRNVAIHDYQKPNLEVVRRIILERLDDFLTAHAPDGAIAFGCAAGDARSWGWQATISTSNHVR